MSPRAPGVCPTGCAPGRKNCSRWTSPWRTRPYWSCPAMTAPWRLKLLNQGGVVGRDEVVQHARAAAGAHALGAENVLVGDRYPRQGGRLACGDALIGSLGCGQRSACVDCDEAVEGAIELADPVQKAAVQLHTRKLPARRPAISWATDLSYMQRSCCGCGRRYSTTRGTR